VTRASEGKRALKLDMQAFHPVELACAVETIQKALGNPHWADSVRT
jgi:hypothetical protein